MNMIRASSQQNFYGLEVSLFLLFLLLFLFYLVIVPSQAEGKSKCQTTCHQHLRKNINFNIKPTSINFLFYLQIDISRLYVVHVMPFFDNIIQYQMSTNKSPISSRYNRKENYESLNYPSLSQPLSPVISTYQPNESALVKKNLQQKQIQDLELKVDLILQHNDKLAAENADLKQKLMQSQKIMATNSHKQRFSRYQIAEQSDYTVRKLNSQLIMKSRQLQLAITELQAIKEVTRKQSLSMQDIITSLTLSNQTLKSQNLKLSQEQHKIREKIEADHRLTIKQTQRKVQQEIIRLQKQKNEQLTRQKAYWNRVNQELNQKFEQQRKQFQNRKNILITKLQQNHSKEIEELREDLLSQYNQQILKIEENSNKRCREQRQKADKLIKSYMENFGQASNTQNEQLKLQIKALKDSLQSRKKFIDGLISSDNERQNLQCTFRQVEQMKNRLKQEIEHLMRQNEMLKIKMTEKYQVELKEAIKIYEDKIEVLSFQATSLSDQNDRLRHKYEEQVTSKIRQRRAFEIEISQLKNIIRKLKAQLKGVQDEFRLNIDGVRDQNASFSMTLMKSVIFEKDKTSFLEEQNRKLRELYDRHEKQVQTEKLQAQEKVKYYESKLEHMKKLIQQQKNEIRQKEQMLEKKLNERQNNLRQSIKKERQHLQHLMSQADEARQNLERRYFDTKQKCTNLEAQLKVAQQNIEHLTSKINQNQGHIQRLRMELQVAGTDQSEKKATIDNWKEHYEGIILRLESDKKQLKSIIDNLNEDNEKLTYKEILLEEQLKKAYNEMSKLSELDKRVIKLGLDQNLVKNMGEIWARGQ